MSMDSYKVVDWSKVEGLRNTYEELGIISFDRRYTHSLDNWDNLPDPMVSDADLLLKEKLKLFKKSSTHQYSNFIQDHKTSRFMRMIKDRYESPKITRNSQQVNWLRPTYIVNFSPLQSNEDFLNTLHNYEVPEIECILVKVYDQPLSFTFGPDHESGPTTPNGGGQ